MYPIYIYIYIHVKILKGNHHLRHLQNCSSDTQINYWVKLEMERGKVNHHEPNLACPENVHRYLQPPKEFKEPLSPPLTAQLKDPGKSFISSTASHACVRSPPNYLVLSALEPGRMQIP